METIFRLATVNDLDSATLILEEAKAFLKEQGVDQWQKGYPNRERLQMDVEAVIGYVLCQDGIVRGTMAIICGHEPDYDIIHEGKWAAEPPYCAIHRIAVSSCMRGGGQSSMMLQQAIALCRENGANSIRVDTHRHNLPMQKFLEKNGFIRRGVIYLQGNTAELGAERIAFDKLL